MCSLLHSTVTTADVIPDYVIWLGGWARFLATEIWVKYIHVMVQFNQLFTHNSCCGLSTNTATSDSAWNSLRETRWGMFLIVEASCNVMAHAQKPDFVFRRNGRVHLNRRGRQFSWLLTTEVCASAVVTLDTPCSEVMWRVLATHSIRQFPLHFPTRASPCAIQFQLDSTTVIFRHYRIT